MFLFSALYNIYTCKHRTVSYFSYSSIWKDTNESFLSLLNFVIIFDLRECSGLNIYVQFCIKYNVVSIIE